MQTHRLTKLRSAEMAFHSVCVLLPLAAYLVQTNTFGRWLIDDAAITFAYARNWVEGHGVVSQPGAQPVEGYSNPLWMLLLAVGKALGIFDSGLTIRTVPDYVWYPKLLGFLSFAVMLWVCRTAVSRSLGSRAGTSVAVVMGLLLAFTPSYVGWASSGLENALYGALTTGLAALFVGAIPNDQLATPRIAAWSGFLAFLAALTRPDGMVYVAAYPIAWMLMYRFSLPWPQLRKAWCAWAAAFGIPLGAFLLSRFATFGAWVPNTALAKRQEFPSLEQFEEITQLVTYAGWSFTLLGTAVVAAATAYGGTSERDAEQRRAILVALVPLALALLSFGVLKRDWMKQHRFATPVWTTGAFVAALAGVRLCVASRRRWFTGSVLSLLLLTACVLTWRLNRDRMRTFTKGTVQVCRIADSFRLFNLYGERLGLQTGSLLLPDLGGSLLTNRYFLIDTAGLVTAEIAHAIHDERLDRAAEFVLEHAKPTFIHNHKPWGHWFLRDARFARDYVSIIDGHDFVRRDAVTDPAALEALKREAPAWFRKVKDYYLAHPEASCGDRLRAGSVPMPEVLRIRPKKSGDRQSPAASAPHTLTDEP